jgi:hypothetical protein
MLLSFAQLPHGEAWGELCKARDHRRPEALPAARGLSAGMAESS